ncbi:hypothetical protein OV079_22435 [Nannocystis pusilla]|uniref:Uncharacterized protein n=1 Tax=Nannocystis pusilla TaxID=889268 RepID=A0A9X3EQ78_9BACT|nr:hypothetical protein [Nannocystis pusilla]MCY1008267.1 hypothetical protein [Nannocystis pusilla]
MIVAEKTVQTFRNTLGELPATRRVLEAQLEQQQAGVATTKLELAKTEIVAPFTMRLREVNAALEQVVTGGQALIVGDGIDVFEIPAQVPVGSLGSLLPPRNPTSRGRSRGRRRGWSRSRRSCASRARGCSGRGRASSAGSAGSTRTRG